MKAPTLGRINGFGWTLLGKREHHAASDSYVATRVFCVLFVPVFPTDAWRVRQVGSRTWTFLGRVPLSPLASRLQKAAMVAAALIVAWGLWPRSTSAPDPVRAANEGTVVGDPADGMVRVELGVPKGREGAAALGVWIDRERSALARMRDSLAQADAQIAAAEQTLRQAQQATAAPAGTPSTPKRAIGGPPADPIGQQANAAATLNQLYGLRRSLLARLGQRERELSDSVRAYEGD